MAEDDKPREKPVPPVSKPGHAKGIPKVPPLLRGMRRVWKRTPSESETPEEKNLRAMLDGNKSQFVTQMQKLEKEYAEKCREAKAVEREKQAKKASAAVRDGGGVVVEVLIEELLGEFRAEV